MGKPKQQKSPIYTRDTDLDAVADRFKRRLLEIGKTVMKLRQTRGINDTIRKGDKLIVDPEVEKRVHISEEYAEKAAKEYRSRLVHLGARDKVPVKRK